MRAVVDDMPAIEDQDLVGIADGRQPVGDNQRGAALHEMLERGLHQALALSVERAGGFVQQQDRARS